jgi:hypothetical protein
MKATELRIGNYVDLGGGRNLYQIQDEIFGSLNLNPIALTEEWLLKFGFKYYKSWNYWQIKGEHRLKVYPCNISFDFRERFHFEIKEVHQLQNLYFALTGEELEIK